MVTYTPYQEIEMHDYLEDLIVDECVIYYKARENGLMVEKQIEF